MERFFKDKDEFFREAATAIHNVDIVLDIGSGIRPQPFIQSLTHICCEPYDEYIDFLIKENKNIVAIQTTWENIVDIMPEKSVDTIFLLDIIEHLEKDKGIELLNKTLKMARCQVVVFTPMGYVKQYHNDGKDAWGFKGVKWQEHHSGWLPKDFDENWDLYICKNFHDSDNLGRKLPKSFGAFWAIWSSSDNEKYISNKGQLFNSNAIQLVAEIEKKTKNALNNITCKENEDEFKDIIHFIDRNYSNFEWSVIQTIFSKIESMIHQGISLNDLIKLLGKIEVYSRNKGEITTWIQLLDTFNLCELKRNYYKNIDDYLIETENLNKEEKSQLLTNEYFYEALHLTDKKTEELDDMLKSIIEKLTR